MHRLLLGAQLYPWRPQPSFFSGAPQVAELKAALSASEAAVSDMRAQLEEVAQQKVAALMRQSTAETAKSRADASIERLMAELKEQRQQLEQVGMLVARDVEGRRTRGPGMLVSGDSEAEAGFWSVDTSGPCWHECG